jgi:hypothetical protein
MARACLAGGGKRPSARRAIDETGAKPPLFRLPAHRVSGLPLSMNHVIAPSLLGASSGRSEARRDLLELSLNGFIADEA